MSVQYSGGYAVYRALDRMFDDLYKKNTEFKKKIDSVGSVCYDKNIDGVFSIWGDSNDYYYVDNFFQNVVDEEYEDDFCSLRSFTLGREFLYNSKEAYLYIGEVTCDSDDSYGITIYGNDFEEDYPRMEDVLTRKGDDKTWKYLKDTPKEFKEVVSKLDVLLGTEVDHFTIGRVHMVEDVMHVTAYSPHMLCDSFAWDCDNDFSMLCKELVRVLKSFKYEVKEIYWFSRGNLDSVKIRMNPDGECTIVVI